MTSALELLQQLGGDEGFTQANHVRQENAIVFVEFLQRLLHGLLLVLQRHESFGQEDFHVILQIDVFLHVFVDELQVKLIGGNAVVEPGFFLNGIDEVL